MELSHSFKASKRYRGFSLVELMVALVVGLLITLGAFQLFVTSKKTFNHSLAVLERQETLRFIIDSLSYDIRSSSATNMLDDSGVVLSDNSKITLNFDRANSVCDPVDEYTIQYYQSDASEAIYVKSACGSDNINDVASGDSIVLGIASINFRYIDFGLGVRITITMVDELGRLEDQVYKFTIANRSAVGRALELWGNGA